MDLVINENPPEEPTYKVGDLVLGRITGFPFWPAEVTGVKEESVVDKYMITFFPASNAEIAFVGLTQIKAFDQEQRDKMLKAKRPNKLSKTNAVKWDHAVKEICEKLAAQSNGLLEGAEANGPNPDQIKTNGEDAPTPAPAPVPQKNPKTPNRKRRISITEDDEKPVEPAATNSKMKRKKTDAVSRSATSTSTRSSRVTRRFSAAAEADGEHSELEKSIDTSLYTTAVDSSVLDSSVAEEPPEVEMATPRGRSVRLKSMPRKFMDRSITLSEPIPHSLATEQAKIEKAESNGVTSNSMKQDEQANETETDDRAPEPDSSVSDPATSESAKRQSSARLPRRQTKGKAKQKAAPAEQNGESTLNQDENGDLETSVLEEPSKETFEANDQFEFVPDRPAAPPTSTDALGENTEDISTSHIAGDVQNGGSQTEAVNDSGTTRLVADETTAELPQKPTENVTCENAANPPEAKTDDTEKEEGNDMEIGSDPTPTPGIVEEISASFLDIAKAQVSVGASLPRTRGRRSLKETLATKAETTPTDEPELEKSPSEPGLSVSMESPPGPDMKPSGQIDLNTTIPKELDPPSAASTPAEPPAAIRNRRNTTVPLRLQDTVNPVTKTVYSLSGGGKKSKKDLNLSHDGLMSGANSKRELNGKDSEELTTTDEKRMKLLEDSRDIMEACVNLMDATSVDSHDFEEALEMIGILSDKAKITKEILTTYPVIVEIFKKLRYFSGNSALKLPKRVKNEMPQKTAEIRRAAREALDTFKELMATNTKPPAVLLMEQMIATQERHE